MMKRMLVVVCGSLLVPVLAHAQPKTAGDWFKEGETQYNLGNFDQEAEDFKQAFANETDNEKRPAYLYNVAQAYREGGKCRDASFFYKRFLALKDRDTAKPLKPATRAEVEQLIAAMDDCAKKAEAGAGQPPDDTMQPPNSGNGTGTGTGTTGTGTGTTAGTTGTATAHPTTTTKPTGGTTGKQVATNDQDENGSDDDEGNGISATATGAPKLVSARLVGGGAKLGMGNLDVPVEATFGVIAGYPIPINDKMRVDAGILASLTPVGYTNVFSGEKGTASFTMLLANAGLTYNVAPKIDLRGDLGAGVLVIGGLDKMGSPFTEGGANATGALTMAAVRIGVSADYEITPNIVATIAPISFAYSPAKSGLRSDIKSITALDFMIGVGYRM